MRRVVAIPAAVVLALGALSPVVLGAEGDMVSMAGHPAVGTWVVDAEPANPDNALAISTLSPDGTMNDLTGDGPGAGSWAATGDRSAILTIMYPVTDPDAGFQGFFKIRVAFDVAEDGDSFTGTYTVELPEGLEGQAPTGVQFGPIDVTGQRVVAEGPGEPVGPWPPEPPEG